MACSRPPQPMGLRPTPPSWYPQPTKGPLPEPEDSAITKLKRQRLSMQVLSFFSGFFILGGTYRSSLAMSVSDLGHRLAELAWTVV